MIDIEKYLVEKIAERCKKLREDLDISMEKISDRSAISRIENAKIPKSGNFITETVVMDYVNLFDKSFEEIIFGNDKEIEETLEWFFERMFRLIRLKNLDTDKDMYDDYDNLDIEIQKAVLSLVGTFAEYNLKRHNFLKTEDSHMDIRDNSLDGLFMIDKNGKITNFGEVNRTEAINELTAIDLFDMQRKIWLICKKKFINSFKSEVIGAIAQDFKFSSINAISNDWIIRRFNKIIVPLITEKLKSVSIFKIGFMVENLIQEFLDEDLTVSFQKSVPLQRIRPGGYQIKFSINDLKSSLGNHDNPIEIIDSVIINSLQQEGVSFNEYLKYGITVEKIYKENKIEEVEIEEILNRVEHNRYIDKGLNNQPILEWGPIFSTSDLNSMEEREEAFQEWHENKHFKNQNIPGYLTNNSQILNSLQNRMNKKTYEMIDEYIDIQNNLLKLLTDEDLMKFSI